MKALELWGGHECTVNRVGDVFFDQTRLSGHESRPSDLELFAELGLSRIRYPVLWERVSPHAPDVADWSWTDARLGRLRRLGLKPIVGLVHHGSGPAYTSLIDDAFSAGLAEHAAAAAARYPWIDAWTPINEPLTTARFSALYGLWSPHVRDERLFWVALLNQVDATRLAMRRIRHVNSQARLIQTEDLGRTHSTEDLADQARFDNARRWMTWDLLFGRVGPDHGLWPHLVGLGLGDRLRAILDDPCPPDVIGINHYLTSDRLLDHRHQLYTDANRGGNGRDAYADVEAIRVLQPPPGGLASALAEAWTRYGCCLAVTEVHNGCTREEQLRWIAEAWKCAIDLRARGVEVEAVTAWALLGSFNWNRLLTAVDGDYEPGAFDVRGPAPRATAVADLLRRLAAGKTPSPAALGQGWWRRDIRLQHKPVFRDLGSLEPAPSRCTPWRSTRPILITGATGTLGKAFARACEWRGLDYVLTDRETLPLHGAASRTREILEDIDPWMVINGAGWVRVDEAESASGPCRAANAEGAIALARSSRDLDLPFVTFSSDLVFDGESDRPYLETDQTRPLNVYGMSKREAEEGVLRLGGRALVVRTAAFFSPHDPYNFAADVVRRQRAGQTIAAANDLIVSPTYVPHLVDAVLDLAMDGEQGLWHLANKGAVSWCAFAEQITEATGGDRTLVEPRPAASFQWPAPRPKYVPLLSGRGILMPSLEFAVSQYAGCVR